MIRLALAIFAIDLVLLAALLWTAHRTPTEPTYAVQRERAAMRQELRTELVRQAVEARTPSMDYADVAAWELEQAAWFDAGQPMSATEVES